MSLGGEGCTKENPLEVTPAGAFQYKAYDTTGALIVQGWFTLNIIDSTHINGEWHFARVNRYQETGPQVGNGKLVGGFDQGNLWVGLNPEYIDNNITLHGKLVGKSYSGTWIWDSFIGITNRGTFTAIKS